MHSAKHGKIKIRTLLRVTLALLCFIMPLIALAQGTPDPEDTPIDGGLSLLLAAGVGYGVKKYRDAKNARVDSE